VSGTFKIIFQP